MKNLTLTLLLSFCFSFQTQAIDSGNKSLFISIDQYDSWPNQPKNTDLSNLQQLLSKNFSFETDHLENPNRNQIYAALKKYQDQVYSEESQLLIYFSGRGLFEETSSQWYLIPKDGKNQADDPFQDSYLSVDKIKGIINNIPCKHVLVIFDLNAPQKSFTQIPFKGKPELRKLDTTDPTIRNQFIKYVLQYRSRLYLAYASQGRSTLVKQLSDILRGEWEDGILTVLELRGSLEDRSIYPQFGHFGTHESGGNFLFVESDYGQVEVSQDADDLNNDQAYQFLLEGREKFPEDVSLLFAEINYYLKKNRLHELPDKLNEAIKVEPKNITLYTTLGNVYDNLYQQEDAKKNTETAKEYWKLAMDNHNQALEIDSSNFDAMYSIGTMYYNRAAKNSTQLTKIADDYSREGIKKYDALSEVIKADFKLALPYFQKCEKFNPNDRNTLLGLKEIYARIDELDLSMEFKKRLDNVLNGKTNEESYFK